MSSSHLWRVLQQSKVPARVGLRFHPSPPPYTESSQSLDFSILVNYRALAHRPRAPQGRPSFPFDSWTRGGGPEGWPWFAYATTSMGSDDSAYSTATASSTASTRSLVTAPVYSGDLPRPSASVVQTLDEGTANRLPTNVPVVVGAILDSLGLIGLLMAVWVWRRTVKRRRQPYPVTKEESNTGRVPNLTRLHSMTC